MELGVAGGCAGDLMTTLSRPRDERAMGGCATLENGLVLKRPGLGDEFPSRVFYESSAGVLKIWIKVGAKKYARPICRMTVHRG